MTRPPLAPRLLMRWLLPARIHDQVAGDLEEGWHQTPHNKRFWREAVRSIWEA